MVFELHLYFILDSRGISIKEESKKIKNLEKIMQEKEIDLSNNI